MKNQSSKPTEYSVVDWDTGKVIDVVLDEEQAFYLAWFHAEVSNTYHFVRDSKPRVITPHTCDGSCGGCLEGQMKNERSSYKMGCA